MTEKQPDHTEQPVRAVIPRVRVLLQAFGPGAPVLGISELARRSGLPKTTVHRLARELTASEFLVRDGDRYQLGPWLFELGQHVTGHRSLRVLAAPHLEDLSRATSETVVLGIPGHGEMLFAEKYVGSHGRGQVVTRVEGRVPLNCGASGKVVLAFGNPQRLAELCAHDLERRTPFTNSDPERLRTELQAVRRQGYAVERQELVVGYGAVAAPVWCKTELIAALTVVAPISRLKVARFSPAVRLAARGLSRALSQRDLNV